MKEWLLVFVTATGDPGVAGPYTTRLCIQLMKTTPHSMCVLSQHPLVTIKFPPQKVQDVRDNAKARKAN